MTTEKQGIARVGLENGLIVHLYDHSRRLAGDRWLVVFVALVDINIVQIYEKKHKPTVSLDTLRTALGDRTQYRYEKRSYFVDEKEKDKIFNQLKKDFLDTKLPYISKSDFAEKFILRKYEETHLTSKKILDAH